MASIVRFLFHLLLIYTLQMQVSSAVTDVFVKTGDDLILNLTALIPSDTKVWSWQFTNKAIVTFITGLKPEVQKSHTGRIKILDEKFNVKLKNLQKSDSGIYIAKVTTPIDKELTQYNVTVQDPVSPVDLTFTCTFGSSSYNLTATCRTDDSSISITLRCENQTCNHEGGERRSVTTSGSSLHIYKLKESIVCNHSNRVSMNASIANIENRCTKPGEPRKHYMHWYLLILLVLLLPMIYFGYRKHKKAGDKSNVDNTIYDLPQVNGQTETLKETAEAEASSPTTTYSTVGPYISKKATKTSGNVQPESVYSLIKAE